MLDFRNMIQRYYMPEIASITTVLFLLGSFIHVSFDLSAWSIITRAIIGSIWTAFILFVLVMIDLKGVKK